MAFNPPNIYTDASGVSTINGQTYTQTSPGLYVGNVVGPGAVSPTNPSTPAGADALARLSVILTQYGLGDLIDWVRTKLVDGATEAQIQIELYEQPAFKSRFPAIESRRVNGFSAMSVADMLAYEQQVQQIMRMAGLPAGYGNSQFSQGLLANNVSAAELSDRVQQGYMKVSQAPPQVRDAFNTYFGANSDRALLTIFLDPENSLPELEKMAMTSYVGGIGKIFSTNLGMDAARKVADTGLSEAAVWAGFRQLDSLTPLFNETLDEANNDLTKEGVGVGAVFGTQAGAESELEKRRSTRTNSFGGSGQGGALSTQQGAVGLGVANQ